MRARQRERRNITIRPPHHLTREERAQGVRLRLLDLRDPLAEEQPSVRGDCGDARPCPYVSCKHHLYLDVNEESGTIKLNYPDKEVWELNETCSLDVADRGGITLEEVGDLLNVTRERVRQIEVRGLLKALSGLPPDQRERALRSLKEREPEQTRETDEEPVERYSARDIPRGELPPPVSRDLYRCKRCSVRVNETDRAGHAARHGLTGPPTKHFEPAGKARPVDVSSAPLPSGRIPRKRRVFLSK